VIRARIVGLGDPNLRPADTFTTGVEALDKVLGGGLPKGTVILLGGSEGGGKSTLCTEALVLAGCKKKMLVSGEEREVAVNARAARLELKPDPDSSKLVYSTDSDELLAAAREFRPDLLIVDSAQAFTTISNGLRGGPGSASQIKYLTMALVKMAKDNGMSVVIICQINQDGSLAGPQKMKHWVDAVIELRRNEKTGARTIRALKSRICATHIRYPLLMTERGLKLRQDVVSTDVVEKPMSEETRDAASYSAKMARPSSKSPDQTDCEDGDDDDIEPRFDRGITVKTLKDVADALKHAEGIEKQEDIARKREERKEKAAERVESRVIPFRRRS